MEISKSLDMKKIDVFGGMKTNLLVCPLCGDKYTHLKFPKVIFGKDNYEAWEGRGDLIIIPVECECGSKWELCLGYHKGYNLLFSRIVELCS
ncbi:MAG: hypothetical protein JRF56_19680 [Deltaproteobacteria bacterium]|jgi:hypothetical protein|nr:hypothetical protein [Deltaproteobacteria bacterium]